MCAPLGLRRPVVDRQGKLDSSIRDDAGRRATDEQFPVSHFAIGNRATIHPSDRRSLVGSVLAKLSDHDALNEKKKKLSYKKPLADAANAKAPPVGNPKSKGDGGKGKGKRAEPQRPMLIRLEEP